MIDIIPATQDLVDRFVYPAAKADGAQGVFNATQIILKDDEVVGYLSINAVPTILCWLHKTKMHASDSFIVKMFFENYVRNVCGSDIVILPCPQSSPLYPYMTKLGYSECPGDVLFIKNLQKNVNSIK
jgi:hypothetical protein